MRLFFSTNIPLLFSFLLFTGCDADDDVVVNPGDIKSMIDVKIKVGDILYENLDATITVRGYNASDAEEFTKDYPYIGGSQNIISIPGAHHHYSISTNKWGLLDEQIISFQQLADQRADGPSPTTYVLGGEVQPRRLAAIESYREKLVDGTKKMEPEYKNIFNYNEAGKIINKQFLNYNSESATFEPVRIYLFEYANSQVDKISGYHVNDETPFIEEEYIYKMNGNVSAIVISNYESGVNSVAKFTYDFEAGVISAVYSNSNGTGMNYQCSYQEKNIINDKVLNGAATCSEGIYQYDKNINPFKHLGYQDFFMQNFSANNKIGEDINYMGCSFPDLIASSYEYTYSPDGYPLTLITRYTGGNKTELRFIYE